MPCHPQQFAKPFAALPCTASALLSVLVWQGAAMRRVATCGIAADKVLTGRSWI
jgi:hypothetical protein